MKFGLDRLREDAGLQERLVGSRLALLGHPASVDEHLTHALDVIAGLDKLELTAAFGPQHGLRGDKQDNMIESPEFLHQQCEAERANPRSMICGTMGASPRQHLWAPHFLG